jgi:cell fate (sporulation/competence/biofilm development) regulator YlbF (YheA/YmcA/DUF963 family)
MILILLGAVFTISSSSFATTKDEDKTTGKEKRGDVVDTWEDLKDKCDIGPKFTKLNAIEEISKLKTGERKLDKRIDRVIDHIQKSLNINPQNPKKMWKNFPLWGDDSSHLDPQHGHMVFSEEKKAVKIMMRELEEIEKEIQEIMKNCKPLDEDTLAKLIALKQIIIVYDMAILKLVEADQELAKTAIDDASGMTVNDPDNQEKVDFEIKKANQDYERAKKETTKNHPDKAIDFYRSSWHHAQLAIKFAQM